MAPFLETWLAGRAMKATRRRMREKLGVEPEAPSSIFDLVTPAGARWLHLPDGSWQRWSYLGEAWEPVVGTPPGAPAEALTPAAEAVEWRQSPDGTWERAETA